MKDLLLKHGWEYKALNFMREHENVGLAGTLAYSKTINNGKALYIYRHFQRL